MSSESLDPGRRRFLRLVAAAPVVWAAGLRSLWPQRLDASPIAAAVPEGSPAFPPTPECGDDDEPTPAETEGPFYKPRSPRRSALREAGVGGTPLVLSGRVFTRRCRPLAGVLLDFWHADADGAYDNEGFRLRGHQLTDAAGRYRLTTILPGVYPGRTRHIHVKVQGTGGPVLTTQLYFPGEARNARDFLFRPDLLVTMREGAVGREARFHFVLDRG